MKNYNNIYEQMDDNNFMLSYKGKVGFVEVTALLKILEERLESSETDPRTRKKVYNIAMECYQNLSHHLDNTAAPFSNKGLIIFETDEEKYTIATGNYIFNAKIESLKQKIDHINSLDKAAKKEFYREILENEQYSDKGTAGLGFIDIARKSESELVYNFTSCDDTISFFTLSIDLKRVPQIVAVTC